MTRQDETRQDKTRRQDKITCDKTRQGKGRQDKIKQDARALTLTSAVSYSIVNVFFAFVSVVSLSLDVVFRLDVATGSTTSRNPLEALRGILVSTLRAEGPKGMRERKRDGNLDREMEI